MNILSILDNNRFILKYTYNIQERTEGINITAIRLEEPITINQKNKSGS